MLIYWAQSARPMWTDEEMLALNARDRSFAGLRGALWLDQSAPLGWLALERLTLVTFGTSEPAARAVTTLFGIGMLATAAWIGRRWMTPPGAFVFTLLCAVGEWLIFFVLELKHYSADAFGSLLMIAAGAWALDAFERSARLQPSENDALGERVLRWWIIAAVALWFSNGALFVTPAVAVVLVAASLWRDGWTAARASIAGAFIWLASFALSFLLVLRHALGNAFLKNYWAFAFPPADAGITGTVAWTAGLLGPFALKPGGTTLWILFWTAAAIGLACAIAARRPIGWLVATVPVSAILLAVLRIMPPFERLAIWVVPSLYLAVGLSADAAVALAWPRNVAAARRVMGLALAAVAAVVCGNVAQRGIRALEMRPRSNYGLDDRRSARWLLTAIRPGDVVMTTHFALPAIWWYGGVDISDADRAVRLPNDVPMFELGHDAGAGCAQREHDLAATLAGYSRVVVYLGFRLNVLPPGFDYLVLEDFGKRGSLVGYQRYAEESRVAVFDLKQPPHGSLVIPGEPPGQTDTTPQAAPGCVVATPAARW